jgi:predicted nuclease with TOPRIM domain
MNNDTLSKNILDFKNSIEQYKYSFNSVGNLFFKKNSDVFNERFLKLDVSNLEYHTSRLFEIYNIDFEEFTTNTSYDREQEFQKLENTIQELRQKIESSQSTVNVDSIKNSENLANKDVIIQLRIDMNQGKNESDFSNLFPYLPIK